MRYMKRAIHLDFHNMPNIPDFGADFDAKEFTKTLKDAHIDFINLFAKCNIGFAYYPTKIGVIHPNLKFDLFGEIIKECHNQDIGVVAYFNAGLDHEQANRHREWCVVNKNGQVFTENKLDNFFRMMCFNTGYSDYLEDMVKEVLEKYPVDGLWFDCIQQPPCYGNECLEIMTQQGIDILDDRNVADFARQSKIEFASRIKKLVNNDIYLYFNAVAYKDELDYVTHFEIECLPTGEWGYEHFPSTVRYTRNLGKPTLGMTGRFHNTWADFGGIRTKPSLEYDCYQAISNGVGCSIGDHMHPRCKLEPEVYKLIGDVYTKIEELEPWTDDAKAVAEIAIIMPSGCDYGSALPESIENQHIVAGATRMLSELHYQFDVIDEDMDFSKYNVLVLPDNVLLADKLKGKIDGHLKKGGTVISSAFSGLDPEKKGFVLDDWNLKYLGEEEWNVTFFKALEDIGKGIPDMPITIYDQGVAVEAMKENKVLAELHRPYFNKHWDGFHGYFYVPPFEGTGRPALACSGGIYHFSFPVFYSYYKNAVPSYKTLVRNCLEKALSQPLIKVENLPSYGRVTLTQKDNKQMIHLLVFCPELRGKFQVIEEPVIVRNVKIELKTNDVKNVYLAPTKENLSFTLKDGYASVTVPEINGYLMVVFEL